MEIRILKSDEYDLLDELPDPDKIKLSPNNTIVAVALDGDKIVGRLAILNLPHLELLWINPEYRNGLILRRLEQTLINKLKNMGAGLALAFAVNKKMESYLSRLDYTEIATVWKKEL